MNQNLIHPRMPGYQESPALYRVLVWSLVIATLLLPVASIPRVCFEALSPYELLDSSSEAEAELEFEFAERTSFRRREKTRLFLESPATLAKVVAKQPRLRLVKLAPRAITGHFLANGDCAPRLC